MPSPFPGMDPYIEASGMWGDFHGSLLGAVRGALNACLPEGYAASIELYVWTGEAEGRENSRLGEPDVFVREEGEAPRGNTSAVMLAAPSTIVLPRLVTRKHKYIKVVDVRARKVVTVIEVLSPSNKKKGGTDRAVYLEKRNEYLAKQLNFVEIDLLRGGARPPLGRRHPEVIDYYVVVCRTWEFPRAGFWTVGVKDRLPEIPVPVTPDLGNTPLDLRACINRVYDEGRYGTSLPYDEPLKPQPRDQNRGWIVQTLKKS